MTEIYSSFGEAPLDDYDGSLDGDDSLHSVDLGLSSGMMSSSPVILSKPVQKGIVVPHPRDVHKGMKGPDVLALKRAISRAGYRKWGFSFTPGFGGTLEKELKKFQAAYHLKADGVYGPATHKALAKYYRAYEIRLINNTVVTVPWRSTILTAAMVAYNNRYKIHYTQGASRMYLVRNRVKNPQEIYVLSSIWEDCSSFATWMHYQAGRVDPNGFGYNGLGYTGTLATHGRPVPTTQAEPGDFHFYGGWWPFTHVTINVGHGRCISHGSEIGPVLTDVWYRGVSQTRSYA